MEYYVIHERKKYYFSYDSSGLKEAQEFIENHKCKNTTIYRTENYRG